MAGPVRIAILANGAQARSEMTRTGAAMSRMGGLARLSGLGALAGAAGLVALGKSAVTLEAKFSTSMRLIQAATGASSSEMGKLNDLAIQLGADTAFSAGDAADAMLELAKAGIDTKTIMGGGLSGTLTLAAAGGVELGTAATIASNALNTFNLRGQDMAKVAAALAGGANASSASVESLGQGLQQVGPGATNAGLSLQETVAALSAFDAAGIKGSDAGTSLKTMLTRLVPQTDKAQTAMKGLHLDFTKANGEMLSLTQISQQLKDRLSGLSTEERTTALATLFGSDATRAATVLMKEGAGGIREFIKATNDQGAAQKMAEARMGGTAGALERLSGSVETAQLRLGQELAPAVEATADFFAEKLPPAMESAISVTKDLGHALEPVASALKDVGGFAADAAGFVGDLPDPIKSIGVQAGIAALVLPRLTGAVGSATGAMSLNILKLKQMRAELSYTATRSQALSGVMGRLGAAAGAAAGIGGMVLLAQGSKKAGTAAGDLMTTLGGAATGFAVGGPIGAAVGGLGGLFMALSRHTDRSTESARQLTRELQNVDASKVAADALEDLRGTLDQVTGAYTSATRAAVLHRLEENGMIDTAKKWGISAREMVNAALGMGAGLKQVSPAIRDTKLQIADLDKQQQAIATNSRNFTDTGLSTEATDAYNALQKQKNALRGNLEELRQMPGALKDMGRETRTAYLATQDLTTLQGKLPRRVYTAIEATGITPTIRGVALVAKKYSLVPKEINPILKALGIDATVKDVERVGNQIRETGKMKPDFSPARQAVDGFVAHFAQQVSNAKGQASSGGSEIGRNLAAGMAGGIANNAWQAINAAGVMVTQAIQEANRKADAKSPSRKMRQLGDWMGEGLVEGLTRQERDAQEAGRRLANAALVGSTGNRWGAGAIEGRTAAQRARVGGRRADSSLAHGSAVTLVVEGQPLTAIVRRDRAADDRWRRGLEDRD